MPLSHFIRRRRQRFIHWAKHSGRPALNRFLAGQSRVGDPEVFDRGVFPWVPALESRWPAIREEAQAMLALREHIPAFQEISPDQYRISDTDEWKTFWYRGFGHRSPIFARLCPETARAVDAIPEVDTAFFSILSPGKHIIAHRGVFKGMINCHLGVLVPEPRERCRMRVGSSHFHWDPGECRIFDDTFEHEVWNDTDGDRVILMIQFRRPMRAAGRLVTRLFHAVLALTPYVTVAKRNQLASEAQLERVTAAPAAGAQAKPPGDTRAAG